MPRLVGKRSDSSSTATLLILFAILAGVLMEYSGYINVIPGFGQSRQSNQYDRLEEVL